MATAIHVLIIAAIFGGASGGLVSGGAGATGADGDAVTISLASLAGGGAPRTADPRAQQLALLYQKVFAIQSPWQADDQHPTQRSSLQSLIDALDRDAAGRGSSGADRGASDGAGDAVATVAASNPRAGDTGSTHTSQGNGDAAPTGELWGAIEPCWDAMPNISTVPVTLEITLDNAGRVASPPKIVRPDRTVPDEPRLVSEARALAALAACLPRYSPKAPRKGRSFTLSFDPAKAQVRSVDTHSSETAQAGIFKLQP